MTSNNAFKGFETWTSTARMTIKMHSRIFISDLLLCLVIACGIIYYGHGEYVDYVRREMFTAILQLRPLTVETDFLKLKDLIVNECSVFIIVTGLVGIPYYWIVFRFFKWVANRHINDEYVSGSRFVPASQMKEQLQGIETDIPLGQLKIPVNCETKHFFVVGRTGAGKTQVLQAAMTHLQKCGAKIICLDCKGDYLTSNYDPDRDLIFSPTDERTVHWSIFNDVESKLDIDQVICQCLVPNRKDGDPFWTTASRAVLQGILHYAWRTAGRGKVYNKYIWELMQSGASNIAKKLTEIPEGKVGYSMIADPASKQSLGVIANFMQDVTALQVMARQDGEFSIKKWLYDPTPGTLYVVNHIKSRDFQKSILTLLLDMAANEILMMADHPDRRIYFFLDEFSALHKMNSLIELLTRGRSKGASVWLGTQEIGQISTVYGRELVTTIVNNCGSKVILPVAEPETERYLSDLIGDTEIRETSETHSMGPADLRDGINLSRNTKIKKLVLPSSLQSLHELEAIVKFPNVDYTKTTIPYIHYPKNHEYLILRKDMLLSSHTAADSEFSWEAVSSSIWEDYQTSNREF